VHEALHGLQLFHTHSDEITDPITGFPTQPLKYSNIKFIFFFFQDDPPNATDNFMSYRIGEMKTLLHWQWDIIKKNLK
jgi:hypothetical protein